MEVNYITYLLIFLAGSCNGIMDLLQFHFERSVFNGLNDSFWNPEISWMNKWDVDTDFKERFLGSSRWFVFATDGWHLSQFFMIKFIFLAVYFHSPTYWVYDTIGMFALYLGFWVTYESKLFRYE